MAVSVSEVLPAAIPVFPLANALLLPRGVLPLNIFEPRYLAMVRDAMIAERFIGMVQPRASQAAKPPLFGVGGLGRITEIEETKDGRLLIVLAGVTRFTVARELDVTTPYRQVAAVYDAFAGDLGAPPALAAGARAALEETLRGYLDAQGLSADWTAVSEADDESLVTTLSAVCPFDMVEKQALIEAADLRERAATLTALMTFAGGPGLSPGGGRLQ